MKEFASSRVLMLLENRPYLEDPRVRREASALYAAGYQVAVICPSGSKQPWRQTIDGVVIYQYPASLTANGFLGYLWEYGYSLLATFVISLFVLLQEGFDVIHAHNPPDLFVFIAAFYKLLGKSFVYDHHDLAPEMYLSRFEGRGNRLVYRILVQFERLSCRLADHVIATNQSYKTVEMERGRVPEERITIVRNGPNPHRLRAVDPDPELRQKAKTIIGYVGEMSFQDGVDYLLRAVKHLINDLERTDFFCVVIGKGSALADLNALATQLGLNDYVWFTGWVSDADLIRYLSTADICVDPNPSNPFSDRSTMIKMMEYMALGKPIVAFDLREHRVTAQEAAVYARPNDELDFARHIASLMDNPEQRQKRGQLGRKRIEAELAWSHQERHLLKAYARLGLPARSALSETAP